MTLAGGRREEGERRAEWLRLSDEVAGALEEGAPVVALESTVIAHGLPQPRNVELALEMEEIVREKGAIPATVAILEGAVRVGLSGEEIERIGKGATVEKVSTRDIPTVLARGGDGATTVAATSYVARRAGIEVFATGGIGGVHRGHPPDVSADLLELHRTRMLVVCAGAKSILDLPATRESLETLGVLVLGYATDHFPAFYTTSSGLPVDARVERVEEVRSIWREHVRIGGAAAVLLCVPVPVASAIPSETIEVAIAGALEKAAAHRISGKAITPFLLRAVGEATGGESLAANIALLKNNAAVAAEVAAVVTHPG